MQNIQKYVVPLLRKALVAFVLLQLCWIVTAGFALALWYGTYVALKRADVGYATNLQRASWPMYQVSHRIYRLARLPLAWVRLSDYSDRGMRIITSINTLASAGTRTATIVNENIPILLKKEKSAGDVILLRDSIKTLKKTLPKIDEQLLILNVDLPHPDIQNARSYTSVLSALVSESDNILGATSPKRYLLLFLNNKELRPGGGFIGSYAIANVQYYTINTIEIHDVYEADGQLKYHIEPHPAVRAYLGNPDGFLRDSNFSPDFPQNADTAREYLEASLKEEGFDGVVGVTTTALEELVGAWGSLRLPDYKETITKNNIYQKTQENVEKDFFPGSQRKRSFLTSLADTMRVTIDLVDRDKLMHALDVSLRQKHIVLNFESEQIQEAVEAQSWGGKQSEATFDYIMPVEANVGVNKVNFHVKRRLDMALEMDGRTIKRRAKITYDNKPRKGQDTKDTYRNYLQIFLPPNVRVTKAFIGKDRASEPNDFATQDDPRGYKVATMIVEVPPNKTETITIEYESKEYEKHKKGDRYKYDLLIQKQVGLEQMEVVLDMKLPGGARDVQSDSPTSFSLLKDTTYSTSYRL